MKDTTTLQEEQELTPEQKIVLGRVYRLILSWEGDTPEASTREKKDAEPPFNIAAAAEANP